MKVNFNEQFEDEVAKLFHEREKANTGRVVAVGDGIVRISGVTGAQSGELLQVDTQLGGSVSVMVLNLEKDLVGAVVLGRDAEISQDDSVRRTGALLSVPVGRGLQGRVIDPLGNSLDGQPLGEVSGQNPVEQKAPGILARKSVH